MLDIRLNAKMDLRYAGLHRNTEASSRQELPPNQYKVDFTQSKSAYCGRGSSVDSQKSEQSCEDVTYGLPKIKSKTQMDSS